MAVRRAPEGMDKTARMMLVANIVLAVTVLILAGAVLYQGVYAPRVLTVTANTVTAGNTLAGNTTTLANIDQPLSSAELAQVNDEPLSFYVKGGEMLLNYTLTNQVVTSNSPTYNAFVADGKPSVIYVGALSCIYCGENRWAMALALAKFGRFDALYKGYSALQDGDVPTLFWNDYNYTTPSGVDFGNHYASNTINFISAEYLSPITGGFQIKPLSYFISKSTNATYTSALEFMNGTGKFQGTPFTLWGRSLVAGADAVIFGNSTPTGPSDLQITKMSHSQILNALNMSNSQFAWSEYAAADVYIADVCPTINDTAPVCQLPVIKQIEKLIGTA